MCVFVSPFSLFIALQQEEEDDDDEYYLNPVDLLNQRWKKSFQSSHTDRASREEG